MQGDIEQVTYTNISGTMLEIIAKDGVAGMFRALEKRIAQIATTFFLVNQLKYFLAPILFPAW